MDNNLQLTEMSLRYLNTTRKWTMFFAILGFIGCGIMLIGGFFMIVIEFFMQGVSTTHTMPFSFAFLGILYLVLGAAMIIPSVYLLKFSTNARRLCTFRNQDSIDNTFRYLKSYYKFYGILTITVFGLYVVGIVGFMLFFAGSAMLH